MKKLLIKFSHRIMKCSVLRFIWKQLKIPRPVVISNTVTMMDNFSGRQKPFQNFLHCKSRTLNISISIAGRVGRLVKKNISLMFNYAFKAPMLATLDSAKLLLGRFGRCLTLVPRCLPFFKFGGRKVWLTLHGFSVTIFRAVFLFLNQTRLNSKIFFTPQALFKHKFLLFVFIIPLIIVLSSPQCQGANNWREGTGENTPIGTEVVADVDVAIYQNMTDPLDRMLSRYRRKAKLVYASAATLTVETGEVMLSNSDGSVRLMQKNGSNTTVTWSDLVSGSEASSTTYYVYAVQNTVTTSTFSVKISTSSSSPSGYTHYALLGSFRNGNQGDITRIANNDFFIKVGFGTAKTSGTVYQASTAGFIVVHADTSSGDSSTVTLDTREEVGDPWITRAAIEIDNDDHPDRSSMFGVVQPGEYYKTVETGSPNVDLWFYDLVDD